MSTVNLTHDVSALWAVMVLLLAWEGKIKELISQGYLPVETLNVWVVNRRQGKNIVLSSVTKLCWQNIIGILNCNLVHNLLGHMLY